MSFLKSLLRPNNRSLFTSYITLLMGILFFASFALAGPIPTSPEDLTNSAVSTQPYHAHSHSHSHHSHALGKRGIKEFFHKIGSGIKHAFQKVGSVIANVAKSAVGVVRGVTGL